MTVTSMVSTPAAVLSRMVLNTALTGRPAVNGDFAVGQAGIHDVADVVDHVGGITATHQRFCGGRVLCAGKAGTGTHIIVRLAIKTKFRLSVKVPE
jgi:hypothetical protein